jgi:hypothetical protein
MTTMAIATVGSGGGGETASDGSNLTANDNDRAERMQVPEAAKQGKGEIIPGEEDFGALLEGLSPSKLTALTQMSSAQLEIYAAAVAVDLGQSVDIVKFVLKAIRAKVRAGVDTKVLPYPKE